MYHHETHLGAGDILSSINTFIFLAGWFETVRKKRMRIKPRNFVFVKLSSGCNYSSVCVPLCFSVCLLDSC